MGAYQSGLLGQPAKLLFIGSNPIAPSKKQRSDHMKVAGYLIVSLTGAVPFTLRCESFYETDKMFMRSPIFDFVNPDWSTLEYLSDQPVNYAFVDGYPIEVREIDLGHDEED
jgi:hypothetical protein